MPLFSRSSFRTPKKPPRRNKSLPNIAGLDDSLNFTAESIKLDVEAHATGESATQSSLVMKLGDCAVSFEDGHWVVGKHSWKGAWSCYFRGKLFVVGGGTKEYAKLQKHSLKLAEENNLLKYKVELLLDMLAASNADCIVMQKELDALKRAQRKR